MDPWTTGRLRRMGRWEELFADLAGQAERAEAADLAAEVSDRSRREHALLTLADRLRPAVGTSLVVTCVGAGPVRGVLHDVGPDWLLLDGDQLVATAAVLGVTGAGARAETSTSTVDARLDLRWALRTVARDRSGVRLVLVDGSVLAGTVDRVGADHLDLAEHPEGEARRAGAVRQVRLVPLAALAVVRSSS